MHHQEQGWQAPCCCLQQQESMALLREWMAPCWRWRLPLQQIVLAMMIEEGEAFQVGMAHSWCKYAGKYIEGNTFIAATCLFNLYLEGIAL